MGGAHAYAGLMYPWLDDAHPQPDNLNIVGPTVTNTMTSVAAYLGAEQILFSGVDFCHPQAAKAMNPKVSNPKREILEYRNQPSQDLQWAHCRNHTEFRQCP